MTASRRLANWLAMDRESISTKGRTGAGRSRKSRRQAAEHRWWIHGLRIRGLLGLHRIIRGCSFLLVDMKTVFILYGWFRFRPATLAGWAPSREVTRHSFPMDEFCSLTTETCMRPRGTVQTRACWPRWMAIFKTPACLLTGRT